MLMGVFIMDMMDVEIFGILYYNLSKPLLLFFGTKIVESGFFMIFYREVI